MTSNTLPKAVREYNAIRNNSALTARERYDALMSVPTYGRPGGQEVANNQERLRRRRQEIAQRSMNLTAYKTKAQRDDAYAKTLRQFVVTVGKAWHNRIENLAASARATVVYGVGGQDDYDSEAYSKAYRRQFGGARWKNAGAYLLGQEGAYAGNQIVIENYRGTEKARIALASIPKNATWQHTLNNTKLLLDGDLFAVERHRGVWVRYAPVTAKSVVTGWQETGVTVTMTGADLLPYYEHGSTVAVCREENQRKLQIAANSRQIKVAPREIRALSLMRRLCANIYIHRESVRANGACEAGITGWLTKRGFAADTPALPLKKVERESHPALQKAIVQDLLACWRSRHPEAINA